MKLSKSLNREKKQNKRKNGMQVDNKGIFILEGEKVKKSTRKGNTKND
jgi:hypothetical protein